MYSRHEPIGVVQEKTLVIVLKVRSLPFFSLCIPIQTPFLAFRSFFDPSHAYGYPQMYPRPKVVFMNGIPQHRHWILWANSWSCNFISHEDMRSFLHPPLRVIRGTDSGLNVIASFLMMPILDQLAKVVNLITNLTC